MIWLYIILLTLNEGKSNFSWLGGLSPSSGNGHNYGTTRLQILKIRLQTVTNQA